MVPEAPLALFGGLRAAAAPDIEIGAGGLAMLAGSWANRREIDVKKGLLWVVSVFITVLTTLAWLGIALESRPSLGQSTNQQMLIVWIWVAAESVIFVGLLASANITRKILAIVVALVIVVTPAAAATVHLQSTAGYRAMVRDQAAALAPACTGSPIARAASYGGDAPHLLAVLDGSGGAGDWTSHAIDLGWQKTTGEPVQLVVCLGSESRTSVQVCDYSAGGHATRWRFDRVVVVVEASTGRELGRQSFQGSNPEMCPYQKSAGSDEDVNGGQVGWDIAAIWNYIHSWQSRAAV
jgi:hypothetical protein